MKYSYIIIMLCTIVIACTNKFEKEAKVQDTINGKEYNELMNKYGNLPAPGWGANPFQKIPDDSVMKIPYGLTKLQFMESAKKINEWRESDPYQQKIKASRDSFIVAVKAGKATLSYDSAGYAVFICGNKRWIKKLEQGQESKGWVIEDKK
ncbi:hypothetical protein [Solitalea canadensis]|uniref:Lipoprotein n=1 Tax=Solitalea canadensis (strain ATCC 29591 / DSM 3403 / JCM 21819 / LMG 8368 / NBRC 15130 / NCIMB 12057 / USAM 9D) TaxID=929556 RepID=H8KNA7_SOLCM|nr:hypothetical protein [Solitalea canadensis]AFD09440.1 hypothetical protein Solca_4450 [Solitalea canadensis DSM 3403]